MGQYNNYQMYLQFGHNFGKIGQNVILKSILSSF